MTTVNRSGCAGLAGLLSHLLAGVFALALCACGAATGAPATAAKRTPITAPAESTALAFLLVPEGALSDTGAASLEALRTGLVGAGYQVVTAREAAHELTLVVRITAVEEKSMFTIEVNGTRAVKERVHLAASVGAGSRIIDELAVDFVVSNAQVKVDDVIGVVDGLSTSAKVSAFGRELRATAAARESAKQAKDAQATRQAEDEAKKKERVAEEADWNQARATGCRQPTSLTGCDAVRTYLAKYPTGAHAEEARTALEASTPLMEKLQKDENAWKTAGVESCRVEHTRGACAGVEIYVAKFVGGAHFDEAQSLLRSVQ